MERPLGKVTTLIRDLLTMGHSFFIGAMFLVYLRFLYRLPGLSAITPLSATMIRTAPSKKMQHGKKRKGNAVMVIMYLGPTETN